MLYQTLRQCFIAVALASAASLMTPKASADMVIAVSNGALPTYVAGSINTVDVTSGPGTVNIAVWAYDTNPNNRQFDGFNLAFDITPLGGTPGVPSHFTGFTVTNPVIAGTAPQTTRPNAINYDFVVNASAGAPTTLTGESSPIKLFNLSFTASQSTPTGIYDLRFVPNARDTGGIGGSVGINNVSSVGSGGAFTLAGVGGQFQITAVPEPSSMALLGIAGIGGFAWRRMRRRGGWSLGGSESGV